MNYDDNISNIITIMVLCLGVLLKVLSFSLYINYIEASLRVKRLNNINVIIYADDNAVIISNMNINSI